ncbi:MAG: hypothetical protein ACRDD2_09720 [Sarcina sp.]
MGKLDEIKELLNKGLSEKEILDKGYNKGTITKAKNQLPKKVAAQKEVENRDENIVLKLKELLNSIDLDYNYTITIRKEKDSRDNQYTLYEELGRENYIDKIKFLDKKTLVDMAIKLGCGDVKGKDKLKIIEAICDKMEKRLSIGKAFRQ